MATELPGPIRESVAIYARVSTDEQELTQQIEACQKFCAYRGLVVGQVFADKASGKDFTHRPGFFQMIEALRLQKFNGVVVFRVDRLGRNLLEMVNFWQEMDRKGIRLFSVNENLDRTTAMGRLMVNTILSMAQYEREAIAEATKQRLDALKKTGVKLGRPVGVKEGKKRKRKAKKSQMMGGGF